MQLKMSFNQSISSLKKLTTVGIQIPDIRMMEPLYYWTLLVRYHSHDLNTKQKVCYSSHDLNSRLKVSDSGHESRNQWSE